MDDPGQVGQTFEVQIEAFPKLTLSTHQKFMIKQFQTIPRI